MEAVTLPLGVLQAGATLSLLFLLPGLTLGESLVPGATAPLSRAARAVGVSMLVTATASCGLALMGLFRPTILVATLIGLTVLPLHARLPTLPRLPGAGGGDGGSRRPGGWWSPA